MLQRFFFTFIFLSLFLLCPIVSNASQTSDKELAITVIDALIQSLKDHPNQSFEVKVIGQQNSVIGGGSGTQIAKQITVQGGAPGSHTTGEVINMNNGNIEIAQSQANEVMIKKAEEATTILKEMKNILQQKKVDKPSLLSSLKKFGATYVPPAIKVVIESLIKKIFKL